MKNRILILLAVAAFALAGATGMMMSCDDKPKTPDPTCDCTNNVHNGACPAPCPGKGINPPCDCRDPDPTCQEACTETQDNHLGRKDDGTLAACNHNGKTIQGKCECTEQTATITGTTIPITKATGVTVEQMNAAVITISGAYADINLVGDQELFAENVVGVQITSGEAVSLNETTRILSVGCDAVREDISFYLTSNGFAQLQPQTKNTFLADKGNKGREWVAKLMNDRIASVNDFRNIAYDKARGISI